MRLSLRLFAAVIGAVVLTAQNPLAMAVDPYCRLLDETEFTTAYQKARWR